MKEMMIMRLHLPLFAGLLMLATATHAQTPHIVEPGAFGSETGLSDPYHYDPNLVVRDTLQDCILFEREAFETSIDSVERTALYLCSQVRDKRQINRMDDEALALETVLLAYEGAAREWSIQSLFHGVVDMDETMIDDAGLYRGQPLLYASNWFFMTGLRMDMRHTTNLAPVLEAYGQ